jgi:hypothetical protein
MLQKINFDAVKGVQLYAHSADPEDLYMSTGDHLRIVGLYRKEIADLKRQLKKNQIIGLIGSAGSGKTTVANIIERDYGFARVRFAGPIKIMLGSMLESCGVPADKIQEMLDGNLKEIPCDELMGKTPRFAMQTLGTEWGREYINQNIWVKTTMLGVERISETGKSVIIDDVRFPNEVTAIKNAGGRVFRVLRDHEGIPEAGHKSEGQLLEFDESISNIGSVVELENQIARLI